MSIPHAAPAIAINVVKVLRTPAIQSSVVFIREKVCAEKLIPSHKHKIATEATDAIAIAVMINPEEAYLLLASIYHDGDGSTRL